MKPVSGNVFISKMDFNYLPKPSSNQTEILLSKSSCQIGRLIPGSIPVTRLQLTELKILLSRWPECVL